MAINTISRAATALSVISSARGMRFTCKRGNGSIISLVPRSDTGNDGVLSNLATKARCITCIHPIYNNCTR